MDIIRHSKTALAVTCGTSLGDCDEIGLAEMAGATLHVPAGATSQDLTFYSKDPTDGTFLPLHDKDGTAITLSIVASRAYELNVAAFGCHALKLVAATASVDLGITYKG